MLTPTPLAIGMPPLFGVDCAFCVYGTHGIAANPESTNSKKTKIELYRTRCTGSRLKCIATQTDAPLSVSLTSESPARLLLEVLTGANRIAVSSSLSKTVSRSCRSLSRQHTRDAHPSIFRRYPNCPVRPGDADAQRASRSMGALPAHLTSRSFPVKASAAEYWLELPSTSIST